MIQPITPNEQHYNLYFLTFFFYFWKPQHILEFFFSNQKFQIHKIINLSHYIFLFFFFQTWK
jgi:hypothetical protein